MKKIIPVLLFLCAYTYAYSSNLPEGKKLYCKEVYFEKYLNDEFVRDRVNSGIRNIFIIGEDKIYDIDNAPTAYNIDLKDERRIKGWLEFVGKNREFSYYVDFLYSTEQFTRYVFNSDEHSKTIYHFNCSENKNNIY